MAPRRKIPNKKNRYRNKFDFDAINETVTDEHLTYERPEGFDPRRLGLGPAPAAPATATPVATNALVNSSPAAAGSATAFASSSRAAADSATDVASSSHVPASSATVVASSSRAPASSAAIVVASSSCVSASSATAFASSSHVTAGKVTGYASGSRDGVSGSTAVASSSRATASGLRATSNGLTAAADSSTATPESSTSSPRRSQPQCQCTAHGNGECRGARPKRISVVRSRAEIENSIPTDRVTRSRYNGARPSTSREMRPPPLEPYSFNTANDNNPRRSVPLNIPSRPHLRQQITSSDTYEDGSSTSSIQIVPDLPDDSGSEYESLSLDQGSYRRIRRNNRAMTYNGSWPPMSLADLEALLKGERLFYRPGTAAPMPSTLFGGPVRRSSGFMQEPDGGPSHECRGCRGHCNTREQNDGQPRQNRGCCSRCCTHEQNDISDNK